MVSSTPEPVHALLKVEHPGGGWGGGVWIAQGEGSKDSGIVCSCLRCLPPLVGLPRCKVRQLGLARCPKLFGVVVEPVGHCILRQVAVVLAGLAGCLDRDVHFGVVEIDLFAD